MTYEVSETTRDLMAKAIHESKAGVLPWEKLPGDEFTGKQRVDAYRAADAIIRVFSPGRKSIEDVAVALGNEPAVVERLPNNSRRPDIEDMDDGSDYVPE